ncbi:MAG: RNA-binding protein [Candidatus Competibacteraceae bacterium]|jgi:RNA recognition motif-containing protein|nr:MAG: RNA-binding protein [Candidatus Competibacteraceae bacterium]
MKTVFIGNLPSDTTEQEVTDLFSAYGRVHGLRLTRDVFSGLCRGFGFVKMEGHEARAAIGGLNGQELRGQRLKVNEERAPTNARGGRRHR